jgi:hypothetical protein
MIITAWNNGAHHDTGAGYGFKVSIHDRDNYFSREWNEVTIYLEGVENPIIVNIDKKSFWNDQCRELISKEIGCSARLICLRPALGIG